MTGAAMRRTLPWLSVVSVSGPSPPASMLVVPGARLGVRPGAPTFSVLEGGSAQVRMPNSRGEPVSYTLKMIDGTWKIVNIRIGI